MNQTLVRAGIGIVCLPMVFVFWLMLSAHWTKMDALTMKLPMGMRSMVASVIAQSRHGDFNRAKRLDPNVESSMDESAFGGDMDVRQPHQRVNSSEAASFDRQGQARERSGDECGAVTFYTLADSNEDPTDGVYRYAHDKGHAALLCGKSMGAAQVGLEKAIRKEDKLLRFSVGDESALKATMQQDREWLIVTYDNVHETGMAHDLCKVTHPEWKSCLCKLADKNVSCVNGG